MAHLPARAGVRRSNAAANLLTDGSSGSDSRSAGMWRPVTRRGPFGGKCTPDPGPAGRREASNHHGGVRRVTSSSISRAQHRGTQFNPGAARNGGLGTGPGHHIFVLQARSSGGIASVPPGATTSAACAASAPVCPQTRGVEELRIHEIQLSRRVQAGAGPRPHASSAARAGAGRIRPDDRRGDAPRSGWHGDARRRSRSQSDGARISREHHCLAPGAAQRSSTVSPAGPPQSARRSATLPPERRALRRSAGIRQRAGRAVHLTNGAGCVETGRPQRSRSGGVRAERESGGDRKPIVISGGLLLNRHHCSVESAVSIQPTRDQPLGMGRRRGQVEHAARSAPVGVSPGRWGRRRLNDRRTAFEARLQDARGARGGPLRSGRMCRGCPVLG